MTPSASHSKDSNTEKDSADWVTVAGEREPAQRVGGDAARDLNADGESPWFGLNPEI